MSIDESTLLNAVRVLQNGGVAAIPTETVYGLVTRWDNESGRERIYHLKHRPASKLLQMLAADLPQAYASGKILVTPRLERIAGAFWPGALTAIVPTVDKSATVGLRIPDHPFVQELLRRCGFALAATSANLSGEPAAINIQDAVRHLDGEPDLAVDGGVITVTGGKSSTVVSLLDDTPVILREGTITLEEIKAVL